MKGVLRVHYHHHGLPNYFLQPALPCISLWNNEFNRHAQFIIQCSMGDLPTLYIGLVLLVSTDTT